MFSISNEQFSKKKRKAKQTHFSIVVRFTELSVFACKQNKKTIGVQGKNEHIYRLMGNDKKIQSSVFIAGQAAPTRLKVPYSALSR